MFRVIRGRDTRIVASLISVALVMLAVGLLFGASFGSARGVCPVATNYLVIHFTFTATLSGILLATVSMSTQASTATGFQPYDLLCHMELDGTTFGGGWEHGPGNDPLTGPS